METISVKVTKMIELDRDRLFDYFIPIELPILLRGYGLLPAVVKVSEQTGAWDIPGHSRMVHLSDGGTIREEVTSCDRPDLFAYKLSKFTGVFSLLVTGANGEWRFKRINSQLTEVSWEYYFDAKGTFTRLILQPIIELLFYRYMQQIVEDLSILAKKSLAE